MKARAFLFLAAMLGVLCRHAAGHAQPAPINYQQDPQTYRLIADELKALEQARAQVGLAGPIGWTIAGGVTTGTGLFIVLIGLLAQSAHAGCEPTPGGSELCEEPAYGPILIIGGVATVAGVVMLAVALPTLFSRIDERRKLGVRIKELRRAIGHADAGSGPSLARAAPVLRLRF